MPHPCLACAKNGTSCCQNYQVILTTGDTCRIASFTGSQDFIGLEDPVPEFVEPDYDPQWLPLVMQADHHVRTVKRNSEQKCVMLTETGCRLPPEQRPLICRLYPYTYNEQGILGIDPACPISQCLNWESVLADMEMQKDKAGLWLNLLYDEIHAQNLAAMQGQTPLG